MSIVDITTPVTFDDTIISKEYHTYLPYASTSYKNNDEIRIPVFNQDSYTLPSESFLVVEGNILHADSTATAVKAISNDTYIVANGFAHLFSDIRYELNGIIVDQTKNPGIATTMKGWCSLSKAKQDLATANGWNNTQVLVRSNGFFSVEIPLASLLGFAEDYKKVIVNIKQELVLIRATSDKNVWSANAADVDNLTVKLRRVAWRIPHIQVSDSTRINLLKVVEKDPWIDMGFMQWELHEYPKLPQTTEHTWTVKSTNKLETPRFVIVGFQTGKKDVDDQNASHFNHCQVVTMKLFLNGVQYPYDNIMVDFEARKYATFYHMYSHFQRIYYDKPDEPMLSYDDYRTNAPLIVIDCSNQNETVKGGSVDVRLEWTTKANVPNNTRAFCLILHDTVARYRPLSSLVHIL